MNSYFDSLFKLDSKSIKQVNKTLIMIKDNPKQPSLSMHSIDRMKCDENFKSVRVNDDIRIILYHQNSDYAILYVDHHAEAYAWCKGKYFKKSDFGAAYIYDTVMIEEKVKKSKEDCCEFVESIMEKAHVKKKYLVRLGIDAEYADILMKVQNEDALIEYVNVLPEEIQDAVIDLATETKSFEEVYLQLSAKDSDESIGGLMHRDAKRRFYMTSTDDELMRIIEENNFEKWQLFLHPTQEKIVCKHFNGPALIEGAAGTGKTIVGIHRAVYLAQNVYKKQDNKRIVVCTFSKKLAIDIEKRVQVLIDQKNIENNIEVLTIDTLISDELKKAGVYLRIALEEVSQLFSNLYRKYNFHETEKFLQYEYREVIEKNNITTLEEYLNAERKGLIIPLNERKRIEIWKFFSEFQREKKTKNCYTFLDRANQLTELYSNGKIAPKIDSLIIDEAQDLESVKIKALCMCVRQDKNNIFILSDSNQRVYRLKTWKKDVAINVVGRTNYLYINYRTSQQINQFAISQFNELSHEDYIFGNRCLLEGIKPVVKVYENDSKKFTLIGELIEELKTDNYQLGEICVICKSKNDCNQVHGALSVLGIESVILTGVLVPEEMNYLNICTSVGVKGLEFKAVIALDFDKIGEGKENYYCDLVKEEEIKKLVACEKYVVASRPRDLLFIIDQKQ